MEYSRGKQNMRNLMIRVYDSHHPQADCKELGSALEPYAR